jgi:hypothetical protein
VILLAWTRDSTPETGGDGMMVIRKIGVVSAAKIFGALYAGLGLVFGVIFALFSMVAGLATMSQSEGGPPAGLGAIFGVGAIVLFPILYGVIGLIGGALSAALYNLFANMVGGLEIETHAAGVP